MPTYEITAPDGRTFDVDAPEGATQDQVIAYAQGEFARMQRKGAADKYAGEDVAQMGGLSRFAGGAKHAWDSAAMGLQNLMPDFVKRGVASADEALGLTPLKQEQVEQGKAFVAEGGKAAKAGEIAGDVAITAVPAMRAMRGVQVAGRVLPKAAALANPYVAAGISGAGTGYVFAPEDKEKAAGAGAIGGILGEGLGRVLTKTIGGLFSRGVTPEAKQLMDEGVNVPLWKANESPVLRNLAERAKALPVTGTLMKQQEAAAIRDYNRTLVKGATPPLPVLDEASGVLRWVQPKQAEVKEVGQEGMRKLAERFNQAYDAVYEGRRIPIDDAFGNEVSQIARATEAYTPGAAADVGGAIRRMNDTLRAGTETTRTVSPIVDVAGNPFASETLGHAGVSNQNFKRALDQLNDSVTSAWRAGDAERAQALELVRDAVTGLRQRGLPPEVQSMLRPVNDAYANYKLLQRASASMGAVRNEGIVTPLQMTNAVKALDKSAGKARTTQGTARGQQAAQNAQKVLGSELPEVGPGTAEKLALMGGAYTLGPAGMAGLALLTRPGQRALQGGYGFQEAVRNRPDLLADMLRSAAAARAQEQASN